MFNRFFYRINGICGCLRDLKFLFALWKYPLEGVQKMCLNYIGKILEKNLSFHNSGDSSSVTTNIGGAFSIWPNISPQKSLCCGVMMSEWPNITLVPANLYPKLWGNGEALNFLIFVATNYCELKPFLGIILK